LFAVSPRPWRLLRLLLLLLLLLRLRLLLREARPAQ
jgi:hypothetical protein